MHCIFSSPQDIALLLLESGAQVNSQNNSGGTPLFLAIEGPHKHISQVRLLLADYEYLSEA